MGRYWNTNYHSGKFGFGCESSSDPEIFGMTVLSDNYDFDSTVDYYLEDDKESMTQCYLTLEEQFNILDVPVDERRYVFPDDETRYEYVRSLNDYVFRVATEQEPKDNVCWSVDGKTCVERFDGSALAQFRIALGIAIYSDLHLHGCCELNAEF